MDDPPLSYRDLIRLRWNLLDWAAIRRRLLIAAGIAALEAVMVVMILFRFPS